jgi:hypothetical protein
MYQSTDLQLHGGSKVISASSFWILYRPMPNGAHVINRKPACLVSKVEGDTHRAYSFKVYKRCARARSQNSDQFKLHWLAYRLALWLSSFAFHFACVCPPLMLNAPSKHHRSNGLRDAGALSDKKELFANVNPSCCPMLYVTRRHFPRNLGILKAGNIPALIQPHIFLCEWRTTSDNS